jgi:quinol monooxygenase YgiN
MIIVSGRLYIRAGKRDAFLAMSREAIGQARQAKGCRDFVVAADPLEADRVNVYEEWDSEEALLAFRGEGPDGRQVSLIVRGDVRRHAVASTGPA